MTDLLVGKWLGILTVGVVVGLNALIGWKIGYLISVNSGKLGVYELIAKLTFASISAAPLAGSAYFAIMERTIHARLIFLVLFVICIGIVFSWWDLLLSPVGVF